MRRGLVWNLLLILAWTAAACQNASATPPEQVLSLRLGRETAVPSGYYDLCRRSHPVCRQTGSGRPARLTDERLKQLAAINARVNRAMLAVADGRRTGGADVWRVDARAGDCEDFALAKKQLLMQMGWPSSGLLIALVETRSGQPHAVLVARTDRGDYVLDNLRDRVVLWSRTGYRWRMIQSPTRTWAWHRL